jgi:hypothetical protein
MTLKYLLKKTIICLGAIFLISVTTAVVQSCCEVTFCIYLDKIFLVAKDDSGEALKDYNGAVYAKAFTLEMHTAIEYEEPCVYNMSSFSLLSNAYATSCNHVFRSDAITTFDISADKRFDQFHDSGSRLNDLFEIVNSSGVYEDGGNGPVKLNLLASPDDTGTFVFRVHIELASGKILDTTSIPVKLIK